MISREKPLLKLIMLLLVVTFMTGCEKTSDVSPNTIDDDEIEGGIGKTFIFYGPAKSIGSGVVRTWVEMTKERKPVAIGINFSAKAATLKNLPLEQTMYHLQFPKQANLAPFEGVMFDWNPKGHIPDPLYGIPHFDFHFYMIPKMEHMAIPEEPGHPHSEAFAKNYMPENYISYNYAIAGMGNHWVPASAPEINGGSFIKTLILGAYQNKQIFIEPMITLEYLQSLKPNETVTESISQFPKVQKSGYYPMNYTITYDDTPGEYKIALTDMYYREAE